MRRHKAWLAAALLGRLAGGLASLFLLARMLGPADYGLVATVFAYAGIAALLTDFGCSIRLLRDIGAQPQRAGEIVGECLRVKTVLVAVASVLLLPVLWLWPERAGAIAMLYGATIGLSYGELALVALRALGRYGVETGVVAAGTLIFVLLLAWAALEGADLMGVALAVLGARAAQAVLSFVALVRFARLGKWLGPVVGPIRQTAGLALDTILTVLSGQIDVVLVSAVLGLHATGLYQLGARIASYAMLPSQVLAGVYTPALSARHFAGDAEARRLEARMRIEFPLFGALLGGLVALAMPVLSPWLFGEAFAMPKEMWAGFGAMVFVRFSAGGWGVALVARRRVRVRLIGQGLGLSLLCLGMIVVVPWLGMVAAPWVVAVATLVTVATYALAGLRLSSPGQAMTSSR